LKKLKVSGPDTLEEVKEAYKNAEDKKDRERLLSISMGHTGNYTGKEIGEAIVRSESSIYRWVKAFRNAGIKGLLLRKKQKGSPPSLSEEDKTALIEGLKEGRWKSAKEIVGWLKERDINIKQGGVYYWLHRLNASWKVPRRSHIKKDEKKAKHSNRKLCLG